MIKPTKVKSLDGYKVWIEFEDGESGEVDLSHLAGKGLFKAWDDRHFFDTVRIDSPYRAIVWGDTDELELCTDTFYLELTGKTIDELMPVVDEVKSVA
jgi:hypothetical protein